MIAIRENYWEPTIPSIITQDSQIFISRSGLAEPSCTINLTKGHKK